MEKMRKCPYCGTLLSETNSIFIHISRYYDKGRTSKQHWICCDCWADTKIQLPYYKLDQLQDPECTVKIKDNVRTCCNCTHLIFKNYKNSSGTCFYTHRIKSFYDRCEHEEEML